MNPVVTTLIANYNLSQYLGNAIDSALEQTYSVYKNIICIVDDGSTDGSWDLIKGYFTDSYAEIVKDETEEGGLLIIREDNTGPYGYTTLIAIKCKNGGPSKARNIGIDYTIDETDIYAILDADDWMNSSKINRCVSVLRKSPIIGAVYADYDTINTETGKVIREYKEPYSRDKLARECIVHSGSLITKQALVNTKEETGYYDETMRTCEDYDLWMRISEKYIIGHVPLALTNVRVTGLNSSFTVDQSVWGRNWQRVVEKAQQRANGQQ